MSSTHPLYVTREAEADADKMSEGEAGVSCYIDTDDLEKAHRVLSEYLGMPEPVIYDDDKTPTTSIVDQDKLAQLIEIQDRMDTGMEMIKEETITRDTLRVEYRTLKDRIEKGFEVINKEEDYRRKTQLRTFMAKLVDEKNNKGAELGALNEKISKYWDHWKTLQSQCGEIVGNDTALWGAFFNIEDKEEWMINYLNDGYQEISDAHLLSDPEFNNQMLVSHEAYCLSHVRDMIINDLI